MGFFEHFNKGKKFRNKTEGQKQEALEVDERLDASEYNSRKLRVEPGINDYTDQLNFHHEVEGYSPEEERMLEQEAGDKNLEDEISSRIENIKKRLTDAEQTYVATDQNDIGYLNELTNRMRNLQQAANKMPADNRHFYEEQIKHVDQRIGILENKIKGTKNIQEGAINEEIEKIKAELKRVETLLTAPPEYN